MCCLRLVIVVFVFVLFVWLSSINSFPNLQQKLEDIWKRGPRAVEEKGGILKGAGTTLKTGYGNTFLKFSDLLLIVCSCFSGYPD